MEVLHIIINQIPEDIILNNSLYEAIQENECMKETFLSEKKRIINSLYTIGNFENIDIRQQNVGYSTPKKRDNKYEYTVSDMISCNLNPNNVYHIAVWNMFLIKKYDSGCITRRYDGNSDIFMSNKSGMIIILPSPNSGSIKNDIERDKHNFLIERNEKKYQFYNYTVRHSFTINVDNDIENRDELFMIMTIIENSYKDFHWHKLSPRRDKVI